MLRLIKNYSMADIRSNAQRMLQNAANDAEVRQLALDIVAGDKDPISRIYDWVKENINYTPDPAGGIGSSGRELFISPSRVVREYRAGKTLGGDCDDMALLTVALMRSVGVSSSMALLDTVGQGFDHAVAEAYSEITGAVIMVDPSTDKFPLGWEEAYTAREVL